MFDALVPYSFVFVVALFLVWYLFGQRRPEPKPLSQAYKDAVLHSLQVFRDCGMLENGEVDEIVFLEIARQRAESDGELAEAAGLLATYAVTHEPLANFHYRSLEYGTPTEDQMSAFRETLTEAPERGRFAALSFEGSYWDGGYVLTRLSDTGFDQLQRSLDPEEAQVRWL